MSEKGRRYADVYKETPLVKAIVGKDEVCIPTRAEPTITYYPL